MRKVICVIVCSFFIAGVCAQSLDKKIKDREKNESKSRFEKLELFNKVLYLIEHQYYKNVDTEKLVVGAIKGMMDTLDPHSAFLDREFFKKMQEDTKGEFGGIGIEVTQKDGVIIIITPIDDTPAYKAGIKAGDKIVEINHESIVGLTLDEAVDKMKGALGSKVILGISRNGINGIKQFEIRRETIKLNPVKETLIKSNYAFIRLTQFQKDAADSVVKAIKKIRKEASKNGGLKGIILDLRSNPGGLLDEAVDLSSVFLKDGVVVSTEERDGKNKELRYVKKIGHKELEIPLVVLINASSASASEIVAGALQDHKRAIIMGTTSFGKGSVQSVVKIDDVSGLKLTIAQYMTPSGRKIQAIGITPDISISEVEGKWVSVHKKESRLLRESDLRNHLTAFEENEEEKKARLLREKESRELRIKLMEEQKTKSVKDDVEGEEYVTNYDPHNDYQVEQAINYIKSLEVLKNINSTMVK